MDGYLQDWLERQHGPASNLDLAVLLINSLDNLEDPPDRLTSVDWFCSVTAQVGRSELTAPCWPAATAWCTPPFWPLPTPPGITGL